MNNETFDWNSRDPLFDEVAHYVVERQAVSASAIREKFVSALTEQTALSSSWSRRIS